MRVVEELQVLVFHLHSEVERRFLANMVNRHCGEWYSVIVTSHLRWGIHRLTLIAVDASPDEQVEVEVSFSEEQVSTHLMVVADATLDHHTIDICTLFRDDVYNGSESHTAIER